MQLLVTKIAFGSESYLALKSELDDVLDQFLVL
jgi:hypothetical protein